MTLQPSSSLLSDIMWQAVSSFLVAQWVKGAHQRREYSNVWKQQAVLVEGKSTLASFGDLENNRMT